MAMRASGTRLRHARLHAVDGLHAVMHEEHLPAAFQLAQDSLAHQLGRIRPDVRDDRQALLRRRVDGGDIAHAGEGHVQRARDRCGRQRQHVDFGAQLFEVFLVGHAEALLLVDDHQAEVLELHVRL